LTKPFYVYSKVSLNFSKLFSKVLHNQPQKALTKNMKYSYISISWTYLCRRARFENGKKTLKFPQNLITKFCCSQKDRQLKCFFPFILSLQLVQFSIISNISSISVILTNEVFLLINSFNVFRDLFIDLSIPLLLQKLLINCFNPLTSILKFFFVWKEK
jgi:hypothetical protein